MLSTNLGRLLNGDGESGRERTLPPIAAPPPSHPSGSQATQTAVPHPPSTTISSPSPFTSGTRSRIPRNLA